MLHTLKQPYSDTLLPSDKRNITGFFYMVLPEQGLVSKLELNKRLVHLFQEQLEKYPDHIAGYEDNVNNSFNVVSPDFLSAFDADIINPLGVGLSINR